MHHDSSPALAYYNEHDRAKAEWLRELIKAGAIAPGEVDERSIADVRSADLVGFAQCHFFAGIGVWSYALRLAGVPDWFPLWTGSCPCPSFSAAGKGQGFDDPRHLWPDWYRLIKERGPGIIFGEQVAAAIGHGWLDLVSGDVEAQDYALAPAVLGAHSAGAPHIRQRLFFLAYSYERIAEECRVAGSQIRAWLQSRGHADGCYSPCLVEESDGDRRTSSLADTELSSTARLGRDSRPSSTAGRLRGGSCDSGIVGIAPGAGREGLTHRGADVHRPGGTTFERTSRESSGSVEEPRDSRPTNGFWRDADWLRCRDGRWRPVEPGTFPLVDGAPFRVGRLRGYGDAINAETAAHFITAAFEAISELRA